MGYRDRMIVPFYYQDKIVGWTARKIVDDKVKYLSEQQPGYVFNLDAQDDDRLFVIAVEGPIDAILLDGVAFLGSEVKQQQSMLIKSLNKKIIVVPDRDTAGEKLIHDAMELGWSVSMPEWDHDVKDINDAVIKYGRLHTLYSIVKHAENQQLKIKLRMKKWLS
jgi:DNA primase